MIGVGNVHRGDDAAGLVVARELRERGIAALEQEGEPVAMIDLFDGRDTILLIDAVRSGAPPGTLHRIDASDAALPAALRGSTSTHALGLGDVIELARALGRLPPRVLVLGVEGARFDTGGEVSADVRAALPRVVAAVAAEL